MMVVYGDALPRNTTNKDESCLPNTKEENNKVMIQPIFEKPNTYYLSVAMGPGGTNIKPK